MKINIKKIASALASAAMFSSTIGFAAAASYPAPFVVSGSPDGAVIVGSSSATAATDWAAAVDISTDLSDRVSSTETTASVSGGDAKTLASGTDLLYLNDDLAENVATITDTDLSTVLADGTFTDDDGTEYDYEQTIVMGTDAPDSSGSGVVFSDSDNDLDDPTILLQLSEDTGTPAYTLTANFNEEVAFNATASEGEEIVLFGKTYTVGTATDGDTLVLLGGASETTVNVGESVTAEVGGTSYEISLAAISTDTDPQASVSINGESKTFTEGQTKKISGVDVYVKTVFRSGDNAGYVIVQLGSDKLTFEDGSAVMVGTDNDDIEGTAVSISGGISAMTKLEINVSASDNDVNHVLEEESFVDPVFGTISLDFVDIKNGPVLEVEEDTGVSDGTRKTLTIEKEGDRELGMGIQVPGLDAVSVPFVYQGELADDDGKTIHIVEGNDLDDEEYFILNSGNYQYLMEMTKVSLSESSGSDVHFKNIITGDTYNNLVDNNNDINETAGTTTTFTLDSQDFTVEAVDSDTVKIYSDDYSTNIAVYPYLGLIDNKDHLVALTDEVIVFNDATASSNKTVELPTGSLAVTFNDVAGGDCQVGLSVTGGSSYTIDANASADEAEDGILVGAVDYVVTANETGADDGDCDAVDVKFALEASQTADGVTEEEDPALLFVEEEDQSESTSDVKNAVLLPTIDDTSHSEATTPVFTGTYDTDSFDDADHTGYVTNFGTYVLKNTKDDDQTLTSLTYSSDQMHAEVFMSEVGASITPGSGGTGGQVSVFKDNEVNSVSGKNLIVVGGSCINTVAAKILDSTVPLCGADFTAKTNAGPGQYIIKVVESPYNSEKIAMLVAGYEAADTVNAKNKVLEGISTDVGENVYPQVSA
ncbi:hypothetical protein GF386_06300 [Candidatus Pacearchaeota archaeon]|nr:hypothetical protein [Candidatus Pacearchaeota archaeon]MBD3283700.1 hypothetical protein [Candidatus Pacearchaeota archaeon]